MDFIIRDVCVVTNFDQVKEKIKDLPPQRVAVAAGTDAQTLIAVTTARDENIAGSILVGDESTIRKTAEEESLDLHDIEIIHVAEPVKAAYLAVQDVS